MELAKKFEEYNNSELTQRRFKILIGGRFKDKAKITEAINSIKRLKRKCEGWYAVEEVRKWRER